MREACSCQLLYILSSGKAFRAIKGSAEVELTALCPASGHIQEVTRCESLAFCSDTIAALASVCMCMCVLVFRFPGRPANRQKNRMAPQ